MTANAKQTPRQAESPFAPFDHARLVELFQLREKHAPSFTCAAYVQGRIDEYVGQNAITAEQLAAAANAAGVSLIDRTLEMTIHAVADREDS